MPRRFSDGDTRIPFLREQWEALPARWAWRLTAWMEKGTGSRVPTSAQEGSPPSHLAMLRLVLEEARGVACPERLGLERVLSARAVLALCSLGRMKAIGMQLLDLAEEELCTLRAS